MSGIDERVVSMVFNNGQFESAIKTTLSSLLGLKKGLDLTESASGLDELSKAGSRFNLGNIGTTIQGASAQFTAFAAVGIAALTNLTNKAVNLGTQLVKSLTIDPISDGFSDYNAKLTSVQTIMNATGASIETVSGYFGELDTYADKTIYNLTDMTGAFAKFTNSGIAMDVSVPAIKGIANMVALAGQDANAASIAMYNFSQSIGNGFLTTQDFNSLKLANVATMEWKNSVIEGAVAAGTLKKSTDGMYTITGAKGVYSDQQLFNDALSEGWATADVLTDVLGDYGDATTEIGAKAQAAAQDVKSWGMMMETLSAGVGTGWTDTFEILIGNVEEAKAIFTPLTATIGGLLDTMSASRNEPLAEWKALGGREAIINSVKNAFNGLVSVIRPIKELWTQMFPAITGDQLATMSKKLEAFTSKLTISSDTGEKIKRIFTGLFSMLQLGIAIVLRIGQTIGAAFGQMGESSGGVLEFAAKIGDLLVKFRTMVSEGEVLNKFFNTLEAVVLTGITAIQEFAKYIGNLFGEDDGGTDSSAVEASIERVKARLGPLQGLIDGVIKVWSYLGDMMKKVWTFFTPVAQAIGDFFANLGTTLGESIATMDFNKTLDAINTGLFAALILIVKKFLGGGISIDAGGGLLSSVREAFDGLTTTMSAMQAQLQAGTLLKIAGAIALMTISVIALSMIDSEKMAKALGALTAMFTQLLIAMGIMTKITASAGFMKLPGLSVAMLTLSVAILVLVGAVKLLSGMSWEELGKGMAGLATMLGLLAGAAKLLSMNSGGLIQAGIGMIAVAIALKILVTVVESFASMDWAYMAKGMAGVAGTLLALGLFTKLLSAGKAGIAQSAGLILLAVALKVIASAVGDFAKFSWEELGKGMAAMAVALLIVAGAMKLIPPTILVTAAGLVVFAAAMVILAGVLKTFGGMSWEEIAKGMVVLAGSLVIIAGAMYLMTGALPGALALIVVAGALTLMVPVLQALGAMTWETILTGLGALAGVFLVLGVAGLVLTPLVPTLLGLGAAIILIGGGVALAGVGILALSVGLAAISVSGAAAALGLTAMVSAILNLIPMAMAALATGIIAFATVIGEAAPVFLVAMVQLITALLTAIDTVAPLIINTLINLITLLLNALLVNVPKFLVMGLKLIKALLDGIANNIGGIVASALNIITQLINGIAAGIPGLVQAGANLILTFITSLTAALDANSAALGKAGGDLAVAIVKGMVNGIKAGLTSVVTAAKDLAKGALDSAKSFLGIKSPSREFRKIGEFSGEGLSIGITKMSSVVGKASAGVANVALTTIKKSMSRVGEALSADMDLSPTIRPVLDLSDIQKNARLIDGLIAPANVNPTSSYNRAAGIAVDTQASNDARIVATNAPTEPVLAFTQNLYSPKALSPVEIYRQTKNQLSVVKGALTTA